MTNSAEVEGSFASGILAHFQEFCLACDPEYLPNSTVPADLVVGITLLSSDEYFFGKGLRIEHLNNVPGCVHLRGRESPPEQGLVVREDHILRAEFRRVRPEPEPRFGF